MTGDDGEPPADNDASATADNVVRLSAHNDPHAASAGVLAYKLLDEIFDQVRNEPEPYRVIFALWGLITRCMILQVDFPPGRLEKAISWHTADLKREGDVLRSLFTQLKEKFGVSDTWGNDLSPGHGRDADYEAFCVTLAKQFGMTKDEVKYWVRLAASALGRIEGGDDGIQAGKAADKVGFIKCDWHRR